MLCSAYSLLGLGTRLGSKGKFICVSFYRKMQDAVLVSVLLAFIAHYILADNTCDSNRRGDCESTTSLHSNIHTTNYKDASLSTKIILNDGVKSPLFGLGVYQASPGGETQQAVRWALENGYRLVDTASRYKNEESVGEGVRLSSIVRDDVFVITKVYDDRHGYEETLQAFNSSLKRLKLDYVDMYLIHSPEPDRVLPTWEAMIKLKEQGLVRFVIPILVLPGLPGLP